MSSPLTFRLKRTLESRTDGSLLIPSRLDGRSHREILDLPLATDHGASRVEDWFELEGMDTNRIAFLGDCEKLDGIGTDLDGGSIFVDGNAGHHVGRRMTAGSIQVSGNCGDLLAEAMREGLIVVAGSAGNRVGAPAPGSRRGMTGGDCLVLGNVGERAVERMRRGMLYVGCHCSSEAANEMIGGTLIVLGVLGPDYCRGMKRGSVIVSNRPVESTRAVFTEGRLFELSFLPLIWRHLSHLTSSLDHLGRGLRFPSTRWTTRQIGDRTNGGQGELLTLERLD